MNADVQTALNTSLRQILVLAEARAGAFIVADLTANLSDRIVSEVIQDVTDVNSYKHWVRQFFSDGLGNSATHNSKPKNYALLDLVQDGASCTWAPSPLLALKLSGKDSIQGFVFLGPGRPESRTEDTLNAIAEIGNQCLAQFSDLVPSSSRDLIRRIGFIGTSGPFRALEEKLKRIARQTDAPILITGERGAGKELAALAIHYYSPRRNKPFLAVNCAALHNDLYAAELFGYRKGAFTGATSDRPGKFKTTDGGTLFLDEITEIPSAVCAGLLRALDQGEIQSLGYDTAVKVNVRILAATNKDIHLLVEQKKFPADVFDRLNVLSVHVPSLRERQEDIPLLVSYFCRKFCLGLDAGGTGICKSCMETGEMDCLEKEVLQRLKDYSWPGNIRELKNTVIKIITESAGSKIGIHHLPVEIRSLARSTQLGGPNSLALQVVLKDHISSVLELTKWNRSAAARLLGLPLSTLVSKMKRLGITPP